MRAPIFPVLRVLALLGLLISVWSKPQSVFAQDPGYCYSWYTIEECCAPAPYCTNPDNCIDAINTSSGEGNQTPQNINVTCDPAQGQEGTCQDFNDYVPVDNGNCCSQRGSFCISDGDCCGSLVCSSDDTCEPYR